MSTERLYHEGNATEKWHSPRGPPERAASASAPYWRVWLRGRGQEKPRPTGFCNPRARLPGEVPDLGSLRLGPAAPLGCGSALQPPALRCALEAGRKGKGGRRRREEERGSLHTPSSPSTQSSPECCCHRCYPCCYHRHRCCHLRRPTGPSAPCCHSRRFLPSTRLFYTHCHYHYYNYFKRREIADQEKRTTYTFPNYSSVSREKRVAGLRRSRQEGQGRVLKGREEELGRCVVESYVRRRPEGAAPLLRGRCVCEKPLPLVSRPASAPAAWGKERRPLLQRRLFWWPPRRRRNMASKAAPSCRLVFCLLISAAVLRPGEQRPRSSPRPTWA